MSLRRLSVVLSLALLAALVLALGVTPAAAQSEGLCSEVGVSTGGNFVVSVPTVGVPAGVEWRCKIVPAVTSLGPGNYAATNAVDVFMIGGESDGTKVGYGWSTLGAVRVCWKTSNAASTVVQFADARGAVGGTGGHHRDYSTLVPVQEGIDAGYSCGDVVVPGTIGFLNSPTAWINPSDDPDRCLVAGQANCIELFQDLP
jgi:hypothetical protein